MTGPLLASIQKLAVQHFTIYSLKLQHSQVSVCPQGECLPLAPRWGGLPHTHTPLGRHPLWQTLPGRHPPGQTPQADAPRADTPCPVLAGIWSTSRRYASHWNTFLLLVMHLPCHSVGPVTLKPLLLVDRHHRLRHVVFISPQMSGSQSAGETTMRSVVMATKHDRQNVVTPGRLLMGDVQIHRHPR